MAFSTFLEWRRFPGSGLPGRAIAAAAARKAEFHHAVRVCVAVGVTYALGAILHIQGFWAVFTAVIVVQTSIGATLTAVRDRLVGTLIGAAVGVGATFVQVHTLTGKSVVLAVTVAVLSFAAAIRPNLRVAPITAAIVILGTTPGLDPLHGAVLRVIEVLIGSAVGVGATLLIFPPRAASAAVERAARTMLVLGELLKLLDAQLEGRQNEEEISASHDAIRTALSSIETVMTEAAQETATRLSQNAPEAVLRVLWRVRNDTVMIDRALREPLPKATAGKLGPPAATMLKAAAEHLSACSAALSARKAVDDAPLNATHDAFEAGVNAFRAARLTGALEFEAAARVFGLIFALENLYSNLIDLGDRIDEYAVRRQPAAWDAWKPLGW